MKIALGCDHRGASAAQAIAKYLGSLGHVVDTHAVCDAESCDYPDAAYAVGRQVQSARVSRGILVCGSGIGMSMAANKVHGVRAALVQDEQAAEASRRHNDANVLCLSGGGSSPDAICRILDVWLDTPFDGGRHERRVSKITAIEEGRHSAEAHLNQGAT